MAIRLIVTDMDGTFLAPDRTISDEAVEVIARLKEKGVLFTFITGRPWCAAERYARRAGIDGPTITCNGAVINQGYEICWRRPMDMVQLRRVLERAGELGLTVLYSRHGRENAMYETNWTRAREDYRVRPPTDSEWATMTVDKVNIMSDGDDRAFVRLLDDIEALKAHYNVVLYGTSGCEIAAKGINKAEALKEFASFRGIDLEDTMAVGDNANDLEMLQQAGIGVAVANATDEAKAAADYVCQRENTDGVIEAIRKFCLEEAV